MGTTYHISYRDSLERGLQEQIDALLADINQSVSTYIENSLISQFNRAKDTFYLPNRYPGEVKGSDQPFSLAKEDFDFQNSRFYHFQINYLASKYVHKVSNAYFDPTLMPLVNYWGFGYKKKKPVLHVDSTAIDSILSFVGFDKVQMQPDVVRQQDKLIKEKSEVELDFSAIAKGYAVDAIAELLQYHGISDYLIEIGGETRASGRNDRHQWWSLGINTPKEDAAYNEFELVIQLHNKALATSGNYRQFYEVDGKKYGHEINPRNGFPEINQLLSATVLASDCMSADAFATAFMVLGLDRSWKLANELEDLEACFIYGDEEGGMSVRYTKGFGKILQ